MSPPGEPQVLCRSYCTQVCGYEDGSEKAAVFLSCGGTVETTGRTGVSTVWKATMLRKYRQNARKLHPESPKLKCIFQPPIFRCFIGVRKDIQIIDIWFKNPKLAQKNPLFLIPPLKKNKTNKSCPPRQNAKCHFCLQNNKSVLLDHKKEWVKCNVTSSLIVKSGSFGELCLW